MQTRKLRRGCLIERLPLVVGGVAASQAFHEAVFESQRVSMNGAGARYFSGDELFVPAPGFREDRPGCDAGFVPDLDGYHIAAVFHCDARRSALSFKVTS